MRARASQQERERASRTVAAVAAEPQKAIDDKDICAHLAEEEHRLISAVRCGISGRIRASSVVATGHASMLPTGTGRRAPPA
jgi:hypothetical protein